MSYNPLIHHRRSIRLKGYDYAQAGLYFITICVEDRLHLFGKIIDGNLELNDAGKMVAHWYQELENKFSKIHCYEMIVMPNHFHCIIEIVANVGNVRNVGNVGDVGADLRVCPRSTDNHNVNTTDNHDVNTTDANITSEGRHAGLPLQERLRLQPDVVFGEHQDSPLGTVMQWFKTMTTNAYIRSVKNNNWERFNGRLWQRNYWEHIIRNDFAYEHISNYIIANPLKWREDIFHG